MVSDGYSGSKAVSVATPADPCLHVIRFTVLLACRMIRAVVASGGYEYHLGNLNILISNELGEFSRDNGAT